MGTGPLDQLAHLNVTLCCELDGEGQTLLRHIQRTRATVRHMWPMPECLGSETELLLCDYAPSLFKRLAWLPGEPKAALIILLPQAGRVDLSEFRAACPDAVLPRPYTPRAIDVALVLALDHFGFGKRARQRLERMEENIHAMRDIERAKRQIMTKNQVGETEAFRMLRGMAMDRRITVAEVAAKLVDSIDIPS